MLLAERLVALVPARVTLVAVILTVLLAEVNVKAFDEVSICPVTLLILIFPASNAVADTDVKPDKVADDPPKAIPVEPIVMLELARAVLGTPDKLINKLSPKTASSFATNTVTPFEPLNLNVSLANSATELFVPSVIVLKIYCDPVISDLYATS